MKTEEQPKYTFTPYTAVGIAEGFEPSDDQDEIIAAWQYIIDHDLWQGLQGFFGRTASALINAGHCHPKEGAQ